MIKQIVIAECDICGVTQKAIQETFRNEANYKLPPGWMQSKTNGQFCICPECCKKLTKEEL